MRVAIVSEQMTELGGGDRFVKILSKIFPQADVFALQISKQTKKFLGRRNVYTTFLNSWFFKRLLPFTRFYFSPFAIETLELKDYDLVISCGANVAKGVVVPIDTIHVGIIFTPSRYSWDRDRNFDRRPLLLRIFVKVFSPILSTLYRIWDIVSVNRIDVPIAISQYIAEKVCKRFRIKTNVIYPGLEDFWFEKKDIISKKELQRQLGVPDRYFLVVSRLYDHKQVDIVIKAAIKAHVNLVVVGDGPDKPYLQELSKGHENIIFLGFIEEDNLIKSLYAHAIAFVFGGIEDFGYTSIEAMAVGTPVIAYNEGGYAETVVHKKTGFLFNNEIELVNYMRLLQDGNNNLFDVHDIINNARRFSFDTFKKHLLTTITKN